MEALLYCENCCVATEKKRCPVCGSRCLRPAYYDDYCLLTRKNVFWINPLKDCLTDNGIEYVSRRSSGSGLAVYGMADEEESLYVRVVNLAAARDLMDAFESAEVQFIDGEEWNLEEESE